MRFGPIVAAVLIFKMFDLCLSLGATATRAPALNWIIGITVWLVLSIIVWLSLHRLEVGSQ